MFSVRVTGLPIQVRDTGLSIKEDIPRSDVNKEYYTQNMEREVFVFFFFFITKLSEMLVSGKIQHLVLNNEFIIYRVLNCNLRGAANSIS